MDKTMVITLIKYAGGVIAILLLVFLIAVITPKLAAFIDKRRKNTPSPSEGGDYIDPKNYTVKDPYGKGEQLEDFDPNYKIYNEDIYGFNKKTKPIRRKNNG